ncbi:DbpA RNA binding domain-containing protein [Treponema zioleckii]|uniref:DbpA RNA binding domain-containing protein n=1 Tax=Treponema zioleckii TaxID=331680 RepID=UPI00168B8D89|nr:DbpA RNA binding domain-containing protein [Treponema zioleckii]
MAFRRENELNMEQVAAYLQDAVSKVKANPDELEELKKVFKKNVPFTLRSFVAAYLLKNSSGAIYRFNSHKNRDEFRARRAESRSRYNRFEEKQIAATTENMESAPAEPRERYVRVQIAPEAAATIFVGIGRNRRVFPRDLVGLFISVAGLEKERIGDIRVLANYSFVQLFKEDAEKAIKALNGYDYRGRKLSVSYSKQREDGEEITADENYENNEPVPNVENVSGHIIDSYTSTTTDTMAQQAAFAAAQEKKSFLDMTDEEILASRAPRSSSTEDIK